MMAGLMSMLCASLFRGKVIAIGNEVIAGRTRSALEK